MKCFVFCLTDCILLSRAKQSDVHEVSVYFRKDQGDEIIKWREENRNLKLENTSKKHSQNKIISIICDEKNKSKQNKTGVPPFDFPNMYLIIGA